MTVTNDDPNFPLQSSGIIQSLTELLRQAQSERVRVLIEVERYCENPGGHCGEEVWYQDGGIAAVRFKFGYGFAKKKRGESHAGL